MDNDTHNRAIKEWLKKGNSIDGMRALRMLGCWRLPARIFDIKPELEAEGYEFDNSWVTDRVAKKTYKLYRIKKVKCEEILV